MTEKKRKTNQRCGSPLHLYACVLVRCALLLVIIGRISESEREEKVLIPLLLHNVFPEEAIIIRRRGWRIEHLSSYSSFFFSSLALSLPISYFLSFIFTDLESTDKWAPSCSVSPRLSSIFCSLRLFSERNFNSFCIRKGLFFSSRKYGGKWKFNHEIPYSISTLRNRALTGGFKYR